MVYESWGQGFELEVTHAIRADDHGSPLGIERIDNALQGLWRGIQVIRVELHGKPTAAWVMNGQIPAPADTQVVPFGNKMNDRRLR